MSYRLDGKVAIITGSSSGIGEATALHFAKLGAAVTLCGRNAERLEAVRQKCVEASGGKSDRFLAILGDLKESDVRNRIVDDTVAKHGHLDIIVPNAGMSGKMVPFEHVTEESFDVVFATNFKSIVFLLQRAAPHLIKVKGSIVAISSITSTCCNPAHHLYSFTKAALDHLISTLSITLGHKGVRVNTIRPGVFETLIDRDDKIFNDEVKLLLESVVPLHRIGNVDEIAHAVGFLVSDNAKYINGANLAVDGGLRFITPTNMPFLKM